MLKFRICATRMGASALPKALALAVVISFMLMNLGAAQPIIANFTIGDKVTAEVEKRTTVENITILPIAAFERQITSVSSIRGNSYFIDSSTSPLARTELEIHVSKNLSDYGAKSIKIEEYVDLAHIVPLGLPLLSLPPSDAPLGIFVRIEAPRGMDWALLKLKYAPEELAIGIDENSIYIVGYDEASKAWVRPERVVDWATAAGVNTREHYVWVNLTRFSVYGVAGALMPAAPQAGPFIIPEREVVSGPVLGREGAAKLRIYGATLAFLLLVVYFALKLRRS